MNKQYPYTLDPSSRKFICPSCLQKKFVRYIDIKTGEYLPEIYGWCDRKDNCNHHLNPLKDGYEKRVWQRKHGNNEQGQVKVISSCLLPKITPKPMSMIPFEQLSISRNNYDENNFIAWLGKLFDQDIVSNLIQLYHIGTSDLWDGATVFWQIDMSGGIRSGKIMLYNPETGRRVKEPHSHIMWMHKKLKIDDYNLRQCLFGEHLLNLNPGKPVGIVESEKTAIIASAYLPDLVWVATGGKEGLSDDKCRSLAGRDVILYPDLSKDGKTYQKWFKKALELNVLIPGSRFTVSDLIEQYANADSKQEGFDLADYLIQYHLQYVIENDNPMQIDNGSQNISEKITEVEKDCDFSVKSEATDTNFFSQSILPSIESGCQLEAFPNDRTLDYLDL